jgi:hypothetical protein
MGSNAQADLAQKSTPALMNKAREAIIFIAFMAMNPG